MQECNVYLHHRQQRIRPAVSRRQHPAAVIVSVIAHAQGNGAKAIFIDAVKEDYEFTELFSEALYVQTVP
jgi:hypothetical protein